ncbi:MAG: membrane-associated protease RseP (regulator of RpoE activity) [Polaribacter sp.]
MNKRSFLFLILVYVGFVIKANAQDGFRFQSKLKIKQKVSFKLINNLIVIPVEINGKMRSFILDTGVNKTIIFNLSENDSIGLSNPKKIKLRGLGGGDAVDAILSEKNNIRVKNMVSYNESIYLILSDFFDLSSKMGITIHGIIGYNLLQNFVVKIKYRTKKIVFYNSKKFMLKKCKKCEVFPIKFYRKKPYVNVQVQLDTIGHHLTNVKMLLDSGGSDALWLFEYSTSEIKTPKRFFKDILGEGLSGVIYGNRGRIPKLQIGSFEIKNPTVSFLDTISTKVARTFRQRNGSLGGGILKRFTVWLDYPKRQIMLKKNGAFKAPFNYNMSGLDIVYNGKQLIKEEEPDLSRNKFSKKNAVTFMTNYSYKFKPSFKIKGVSENSSAAKAGLKAGDLIIEINRKPAHFYNLSDIVSVFREKDKKKIRLKIKRYGVEMIFKFRLEKRI